MYSNVLFVFCLNLISVLCKIREIILSGVLCSIYVQSRVCAVMLMSKHLLVFLGKKNKARVFLLTQLCAIMIIVIKKRPSMVNGVTFILGCFAINWCSI